MVRMRLFSISAFIFLMACNPRAPKTISVTGEGIVHITPDQVELSVGIESSDPSVKVAKARSDEIMAKILIASKELKIEAKDIQSDYVRIDVEYAPTPEERMKVSRYTARRSVKILLHDVTQYDNLSSRLFDEGANILSDVQFRSSQREKLEADARSVAIRDARSKAEAMAKELGLKVGKALQVREGRALDANDPNVNLRFASAKGLAADGANSMAVGEILISSTVSVSWELD